MASGGESAYTLSQLAKMAGVTVQTLHHYDHIGLLQPSARTETGYRLYDEPELLRLQQILFFRELDMPLDKVRQILHDPGFNQVAPSSTIGTCCTGVWNGWCAYSTRSTGRSMA